MEFHLLQWLEDLWFSSAFLLLSAIPSHFGFADTILEVANAVSGATTKMNEAATYKKELESGNVDLSAFNDRSICVEGEADYMDFMYQIDNYLPTKYHYINNNNHFQKFSADYSKAIINYLNL